MNRFQYMCFDHSNGTLFATSDYKKNMIISKSNKQFNKIYSKLHKSAQLGLWESTKSAPHELPTKNDLYVVITDIIYNISIDIFLKNSLNKSILNKECALTKEKINSIIIDLINEENLKYHSDCLKESGKNKIIDALASALSVPNLFYYVIDVFSINEIIASKSLTIMVEDESLRNNVTLWLNMLGKYLINIANCELIMLPSMKCISLVSKCDIKKGDILVPIWKSNKGLICDKYVWPKSNCTDEVIFIINLILKYHVTLGQNKYVKICFNRLIEIDKKERLLRTLSFPVSHLAPCINSQYIE